MEIIKAQKRTMKTHKPNAQTVKADNLNAFKGLGVKITRKNKNG